MHQVMIIEQALVLERDAYCSVCTYDESGLTIRVVITGLAIRDLYRFDCDLNTITKHAVEWALREGVTEGEVVVTTESPDFQRFERYLTTIFRVNQ
ncbi:hypothetical protein MYX04_09790 [Nitrospiraceae bacterium AH_259_D15_M11_P09]|nr:hypothetical protein [Nitrospiraceae bacterium AH_259_D15_M11_P09]